MPSPEYGADASISEKLSLSIALLRTLLSACSALITGPFRGDAAAATLQGHVACAAIRTFTAHTSPRQKQFLNGSTENVYLDFCSSKSVTPESSTLPNGVKIYWLGSKSAKYVFLYFHGGGYTLPASNDHVVYLSALQQNLEKKGFDVAIAVLAYTLATAGSHPTQLREAVESLQYLIETENRSPSDIIVGGDSAGANMTCGLVSHLLHPLPNVPILKLDSPLKGLIFTSPWVSFLDNAESLNKNEYNDVLARQSLSNFHEIWVQKSNYDNYTHPIQASAEWWSGADKLAQDVLIWIGGAEILLDSAHTWAKTFKTRVPKAQIIVSPKEPHVAFIFEKTFGLKEPGVGNRAIEAWIASKL